MLLGLLLLLTTVGLAPQATAPARRARLGDPAPAFTLTDSTGKTHRLANYAGRVVVLEWVDPDCPLVEDRLYRDRVMQDAHRTVGMLDETAVWLAIDSTPAAARARDEQWRTKHALAYPILIDADGTVGRTYDARRTPHMFVIDKKGALRYHGAIDDNRSGGKPKNQVKNYVVNAVRQILADERVTPSQVRPYGCELKRRK